MSYKQRLEKLKQAWNDDKPAESMSGLPNGKYQMEIKRSLLEESKATWNKGHLQVIIHLEVVTGEFKGRKARVMVDLEQKADKKKGFPSGISRFKQYLEIMQLSMPKQLTEGALNEILKETIGMVLNCSAQVNAKGYTNIYLNDLVTAGESDSDDEDEEEEEGTEESEESDEEESDEEDSDDEDDEDDEEEEEEEEEEEAPKKPAPTTAKPSGKPPFNPKAGKSKPSEKVKPAKAEEAEEDDDEDDWDLDDDE